MNTLRFALMTAQHLGLVLPLATKSKDPFGKLVHHGCLDGTKDPSVIQSWFRPWSTLNLGLTFEAGRFALDVDSYKGGDEELGALETAHGRLPHTPMAITGGGGLHYLFKHDPALRLKNGPIAGCKFVEVKTVGGYVAVAPSIHPNGRSYLWDVGALPSETPIADAPAWLLRLALNTKSERQHSSPTGEVHDSFLAVALKEAGLIGDKLSEQKTAVKCPWLSEHSDGRGAGGDSSTVIFAPNDARKLGGFRCAHSHCADRGLIRVARELPKRAVAIAGERYRDAYKFLLQAGAWR